MKEVSIMKKENPVLKVLANMDKSSDESQKELMNLQLNQMKALSDEYNKPSLVIYILLAIFFGGIGLHDFYIGKKRAGIMKLLFFWTGIPSIIAFFNIIGALYNHKNFK